MIVFVSVVYEMYQFGIYSKQALQKSHLYELWKLNLIYAQSAAQLTFYVESKSVDRAILFATDVKQHDVPVSIKIPLTAHDQIFSTY